MNSKPYEVRLAPKIEKWFRKLVERDEAFGSVLLELVVEGELKSNPYPRVEDPKLIKYLHGLNHHSVRFLERTNLRVYLSLDVESQAI